MAWTLARRRRSTRMIDELASAGAAILLISSELPEVLNLSTRILVFRDGPHRRRARARRRDAGRGDADDGRGGVRPRQFGVQVRVRGFGVRGSGFGAVRGRVTGFERCAEPLLASSTVCRIPSPSAPSSSASDACRRWTERRCRRTRRGSGCRGSGRRRRARRPSRSRSCARCRPRGSSRRAGDAWARRGCAVGALSGGVSRRRRIR